MTTKVIYQTLEFRNNNDHIKAEGPFPCMRKDAWLGVGYYFWDTFIDNAHWWGKTAYRKKYVICEAICCFDSEKCLDLYEPEYMLLFNEAAGLLHKYLGCDKDEITVSRVLDFMKNNLPQFNYEAIRINGQRDPSILDLNKYSSLRCSKYIFPFNPSKPEYFNSKPLIQICLLRRNALNLTDFQIVYSCD